LVNDTKTVYFLKDHLGSIRATVLDSATVPVIGFDDYDAWGVSASFPHEGDTECVFAGGVEVFILSALE